MGSGKQTRFFSFDEFKVVLNEDASPQILFIRNPRSLYSALSWSLLKHHIPSLPFLTRLT